MAEVDTFVSNPSYTRFIKDSEVAPIWRLSRYSHQPWLSRAASL